MTNLQCPSIDMNFLVPNGFMFKVDRLPTVSFFTQSIDLPALSLPSLNMPTPLSAIEAPSDVLQFASLNVPFIVDERMNNWVEVFKWMRGLGFPENYPQYSVENRVRNGMVGMSELQRNYSQATLAVLGSNNVPVREFTFVDCFPVTLSGISFSSSNTDVQYATASVELQYSYYYINGLDTVSG